MNVFLSLTHSIGNFIPVPQGFNVGRNLPTSDYWDIALNNIHLWYETKDDYYLNCFLFKQDKNEIEKTKFWLNKFKSWQEFVNKNYLQPFVEYNQENLKPKPFWDEHFSRYEEYRSKSSKIKKVRALEPNNIE